MHSISWFLRHGVVLITIALFASVTPAADPKTALDQLPADTQYFASVLRLGEMVENFGKTNFWKMLWTDKFVQEAWKKAIASYEAGENNLGPIKAILSDPANKDWPKLAGDAVSNEIFVSLGSGGPEAVEVLGMLYSSSNFLQGIAAGVGNANNAEATQKANARRMLIPFNQKPERLKIPELLIGFKVSEPEKVAAQLKRLDDFLPMVLKGGPLEGRVKSAKISDGDFQVLTLDGSMIPWNQVDDALEKIEEKPNEFKPLVTYLKKQTLTVAIGVRQGYLLIAIGAKADHVAKFGAAGDKLAGRAEFKPLAKYAGKPLLSVAYTSETIRQSVAMKAVDVDGYVESIKELLKNVAVLPEDQRQAIEKDVVQLGKEFAKGIKPPKAAMSFSVRSENGWETFTHDYSPTDGVSKAPLTILQHFDGNPLFAAAYRSRTTVEDYQTVVKWLGIIFKHGEKFAETTVPNGDEFVKIYREQAMPLLKELNDIIEKLWFPAVADGQTGIVIDGKWKSNQWHAAMPRSEKPLPMIELGLLLGVSDAVKFEKAVDDVRLWLNKTYAKAREFNPNGDAPAFEIPKPPVVKEKGASLVVIAIPEQAGLDKSVAPTAGLTEKFAAFSLSKGHTQRLLTETPWKATTGPLADPKKPLDSMVYLNHEGIVDLLDPWLKFALGFAPKQEDGPTWAELLPKVLSAARAFRSYSSVTYRDATGTITHSEAIFGDVPAPK